MVIALVALGLAIIFGVMDIVNFAHGEFLMIGMYTGLLTAQPMVFHPLLTLPVAAVVGALLGILCYVSFVKFLLRARGGPGPRDVRSHALLENLALLIFGSEDRTLHHGILVGKSFDVVMGSSFRPQSCCSHPIRLILCRSVAAHKPDQGGKGAHGHGAEPPGGASHGDSHGKNECSGLGSRGRVCDRGRGADCHLLVGQSLCSILFTMIAFAVVALGGFGSSGRLFRRVGGGPDHGITGIGLPDLLNGL